MSQPGHIDGLQFARERGQRDGRLTIESLPRLAESGAQSAAIGYVVAGGENSERRPCLHIDVDGVLQLVCQRCLEPLEHRVELRSELELVTEQHAIDAAEDDVDRVLAGRAMDIRALIEDELILDLPMIPMHEQCGAAAAEEGMRPSPFAALAALKKSGAAD